MKQIRELSFSNVKFIDIETARLVERLELDTPLFDSWVYKLKREKYEMSNEEAIEFFEERAALYPEFAKVVCISIGSVVGGKFYCKSYSGDEATLLKQFNDDLNTVTDKNFRTRLCGIALTRFDLPFLNKRMVINGVRPNHLIDTGELKPWEVTTVDLDKIWKGTGSTHASLLNMTTALGIPSPKSDISGADVGRVYYEGDVERIVKYCERDILAPANIVYKIKHGKLLEHDLEPEEEEELSTLEHIVLGGEFNSDVKAKVVTYMNSLPEEERELAFGVLYALPSQAKGQKTNITKKWINDLKKIMERE